MVLYLRRFAFGQYRPLGGSGAVLVGVRRFPLFFIKVVIHLSDTTPDHFRSGNLHFLTAYFQFIYGFFVKAYFDVNVFWTISRTPYFFSGHTSPPFAVAKLFYHMRPQKSICYFLSARYRLGFSCFFRALPVSALHGKIKGDKSASEVHCECT